MDKHFAIIKESTFYPLIKNIIYTSHGVIDLISRGVIHHYQQIKNLKGEREADDFLDGFFDISEDVKEMINKNPHTAPLTMVSQIIFSNVKPVTIATDKIAIELAGEILNSDFSEPLNASMEYLLITAFALTSKQYREHKDEPLWLFFRYIRNAAAHGGKFYFAKSDPTDSDPKETQWNGFIINKSLHGRKLFKTTKKDGLLKFGDAILFLLDIEREYKITLKEKAIKN